MTLTESQMKRVAEIAAKACLEFGVNYDGVSFAAEEAILAALADPLLKKDMTKFEPDWVTYGQGCEDGYAAAVEQAAKVCDELRHPNWSDEDHAWIRGTEACAAAIRAMKKE